MSGRLRGAFILLRSMKIHRLAHGQTGEDQLPRLIGANFWVADDTV
jgi:hypothetical protein